jgi:hypothetical protein
VGNKTICELSICELTVCEMTVCEMSVWDLSVWDLSVCDLLICQLTVWESFFGNRSLGIEGGPHYTSLSLPTKKRASVLLAVGV